MLSGSDSSDLCAVILDDDDSVVVVVVPVATAEAVMKRSISFLYL